jgi:predicted RNase H-like HicB family nuclease
METNRTMITIELMRSPRAGWYRAHIPNIPAYGDGETEEEALADLKNSLLGYVEEFGLDDVLSRIHQ